MKIKIGVITTKFFKEFIENTIKKLSLDCDIDIYLYKDMKDITNLYPKLHNEYDGFITSGSIPHQVILKSFNNNTKPIISFDSDYVGFYKLFFKLLEENRDLDWNKISYDFRLNISNYLKKDKINQYINLLEQTVQSLCIDSLIDMDNILYNCHIEAMTSGNYDFCITRLSTIIPKLEDKNIKYYFVYPSEEFVLDAFDKLYKDINIIKLKENLPAVVNIRYADIGNVHNNHLQSYNDRYLQLVNLINDFNKENLCDFIIQSSPVGFEIFTGSKVIKEITKNYSVCRLKDYITSNSNLNLSIGYGIGDDINIARINAIKSNNQSSVNNNDSYILNEEEEMIGPLNQDTTYVIQTDIPDNISDLAKKTALSSVTIQKIISVANSNGSDEITAQLLASKLNITSRSANRFLSNLVSAGEASVVSYKQNNSKGRPERVYKINFVKNL